MKILTARQEVKLNMYEVVRMVVDQNSDIITASPVFVESFTEFKGVADGIRANAPLSGAVLTGITADKRVSKLSLSKTCAFVAGLGFAYAAKTKNNTLKAAFDFSENQLKRIKDGEIAARCQAIHDLLLENRAALEPYGVTTDKLQELQAAIDSYTATAPKPRTAVTNRSTIKANIKAQFARADKILEEQMDKLIENFAESAPDFVTEYKKARIIVDEKSKTKEGNPNGENGGNNPPA